MKELKNNADDLARLRKELNRACKKCGQLFAAHGATAPHTRGDECEGFVEKERS